METKKNIRNALIKRQELIFEIESEKNPTFEDMKKKVSEEFLKPEENIEVYNIKGSFGKRIFEIKANIYDSKEDLRKMLALKKTQKQRKTEEEEKKKAEEEAKKAQESVTETSEGKAE